MHIAIDGRQIGPGLPCFVIAEAGVNHNGDIARALQLVDIAAAAGADAVKFQTFSAERLVTRDAPKAQYQVETTGPERSQYAMLAELELSVDDHMQLIKRCNDRGILFLSTPFDEQAADLLHGFGIAAFKTPSGELTNLDFLQHVARFGLPMIVSTGMATLGEVDSAVSAIEASGEPPLALLHCVSNYPAAPTDVNLRAIDTLARAFGVPAGYSDHTVGIAIGLAAAALGACIIEKHYTIDRNLPGPDHRASLEPFELNALVAGIRTIEEALGDGRKRPTPSEASTAAVGRKSLVAARDIVRGAVLTTADISAKRPGTGLAPSLRDALVGRQTRIGIPEGTILSWEMLT
jgi:N,N'-diacetyllegionaminate synthase